MRKQAIIVLLGSLTALLLAAASQAQAGWLRYWHCPPSSYCPLHYLTPNLYSAGAYLNPQPRYTYAPDRHPEIPKLVNVTRFPCPAAVPAMQPYSYPFLNIRPPAADAPAAEPGASSRAD
jgi:hypothetical protein